MKKPRQRRTGVQMLFAHYDKLTLAAQEKVIVALQASLTAKKAQKELFEEGTEAV